MNKLQGQAYAYTSCLDSKPENAVDGDKNTKWQACGFYSWWMYELKSVSCIRRIVLNTCDHASYKYFIEASLDSINWELIAEKETASVCSEDGDIWVLNTNAKYIKITFRYCSLGQIVSLGSFECFGESKVEEFEYLHPGKRFFASKFFSKKNFEQSDAIDDLTNLSIQPMLACGTPAYLHYKDVDFGNGCNEMQGYFGFPVQDKRFPKKLIINIEIRIDSENGPIIGSFEAFRQWAVFSPLACDIKETKGLHDVYLVVTHIDEGQSLYVDWLSFVSSDKLPIPQAAYQEKAVKTNGSYKAFIGLLHSHTCLSDGKNTPEFACEFAREVSHLDFLGITEHSNLFDNPYDSKSSRKLKDIKEYTEKKTEPGKFVALFGSETTWYNGFGHMNIYDEESLYINVCQVKYNNSKYYYDTLKKYPHSINQWNHPWSCGYRHLDLFHPYDADLDKVMYLIEMNPEEDSDNYGLNYYMAALKEGYHVAPCGSQDNHKEDWGIYSSLRTGIVASELTKEGLLEAIRHRRVYFTSAPNLRVIFWVNNSIMGSSITKSEQYEFKFEISNGDEGKRIKSVEVFGSNNTVVIKQDNCDKSVCLNLSKADDKYYFAKITLEDESFAITSPVWIE